MKGRAVNDEFAIRLFRWAQVYADMELRSDFNLVRQFENSAASFYLKVMETLNPPEKRLLARGVLKRFHSYAVAVLNEPSEQGEAEIVSSYLDQGTLASRPERCSGSGPGSRAV